MDLNSLLLTLGATLRLSTPLIFCAMAGLLSERSGIVDIGLEGKMLAGAFAAAAVAALTGSAWAGLGAAILTSVIMALIHGYACISQKGNQVVSGVAVALRTRKQRKGRHRIRNRPGPGPQIGPARQARGNRVD